MSLVFAEGNVEKPVGVVEERCVSDGPAVTGLNAAEPLIDGAMMISNDIGIAPVGQLRACAHAVNGVSVQYGTIL